ncbi:MAG: DUF3108 domain-containing protein [Betaproteobacteria bacterium]|nr:DUF3108 domain-containing protein [Betaproteobacteria bacterium]
MKHSPRLVVALAALAAANLQAAPPARVEIAYQMLRNGSHVADVVTRLEHDGKSYVLTEAWQGRGIFSLLGEAKRTSRGSVAASGLVPEAFLDERRGSAWGEALFDWRAKVLTMRHKGESHQTPLAEPVQDRLSVLFGFAFAFPATNPFTLYSTDGRGVSTNVYDLAGRAPLTTPAGEFATLKIAKRRDRPDDRTTEIWLAVDRYLLPLKVVVTEQDGERLEQIAARLSLAPAP